MTMIAIMLGSLTRDNPLHPVEDARRLLDVRGEPGGRAWCLPAALLGEPPWDAEVVEGDDRGDAQLKRRADHPPVVPELGPGELARPRLDARPLDAEPVRIEASSGEQFHVLPVAMVAVAGVAAELHARHQALARPPVAVGVVALDLVRRRCGAPQETVGEAGHARASLTAGVTVEVLR
jgi:hypothetical protein